MENEQNLIAIAPRPLTTELAELADLTREYAKRSRSSNTRKSYASDWRDFEYWCELKRIRPLPAASHAVAAYLADRATNVWVDRNGITRSPLRVSSLERRLTTITQAHLVAGTEFNRRHPAIRETWKGIKKTIGAPQTRKEPILIDNLREMIEKTPIERNGKIHLKGIRDRAILLIGFAGAFRRSELVGIDMDDIDFIREGLLIKLRRSKTDQEGHGRDVPIPYGTNPLTCPVRALKDWLSASDTKNGPIFRPINRHGQIIGQAPLSDRAVALIIKANPLIKDKAALFSGHSLRAGFATTAAMRGVPEHLIMKQTGHKRSDTIKKYIRVGNMWNENAASKVGL